jgi:hypothetical protein
LQVAILAAPQDQGVLAQHMPPANPRPGGVNENQGSILIGVAGGVPDLPNDRVHYFVPTNPPNDSRVKSLTNILQPTVSLKRQARVGEQYSIYLFRRVAPS